MAIRRHYNNNAAVVSTVGSMSNVATTVTVSDASTFPASFPWTAIIDAGLATAEVVLVTAAAGAVLTITRGYDGTAGQTHASAATFAHVAVQADYDEANSHVVASTAVHGVSGSVVGTTDVQTLTNKTLGSPTITGTSSGANATLSGTLTVTGTAALNGGVTTTVATVASVAASGNLVTSAGNVTASAGTVTGKVVTGGIAPTIFTNEAAATAALPSPANGSIVYLSAPTTTGAAAGLFMWTGTAWTQVTLGTKPAWTYKVATGPSLTTSTFVKVPMTTLVVDRTNVGVTSGQYTVPAGGAGNYLLSGVGSFQSNATGRRVAALFLNGTAIDNTQVQVGASTNITQVPTSAVVMPLAVADVVDLRLFQDSGISLTSGVCSLTVVQL